MQLSIKNRLTLGSLFLFTLMMCSVVLGLYYLIAVDDEAKAVLADNYDSVRHIHGMHSELDRAATEKHAALLGFDSLMAAQEANITEPGEEPITAALRQHVEAWRVDTTGTAAGQMLIRRDLDALLALNLGAIARKSEQARINSGHALFWLFLLAILITLIGLGFTVAFPTVIAAPIVRLQEAVKQLAAHNYHHRVPPFRMTELDELAASFNDMAMELEAYEHSNLAQLMREKNRAEAVINTLQDASIGVDTDGVVLFANRPALKLLGIAEPHVVGRAASEVGAHSALFKQVLIGDGTAPVHTLVDGEAQVYLTSAVPIEGAKGSLGTLYLLRNITSFHQRDQAKTNFLATISHELKTPLASSDIGLTLLERANAEPLTFDQRAIIDDLRKDHQRLVRIVGELLDLAQAESGHIRLHMGEPRIGDVVNNALDAVRTSAQQKNIRFDMRIADTEHRIKADADKAAWVLVNLLSNAVRHSPAGGTIALHSARAAGHTALTVADDGPGVPADEQDLLFTRFASHGSSAPSSTGLGLSIAKEFMQAMGGSISFDHLRAQGASFTLHFLTSN